MRYTPLLFALHAFALISRLSAAEVRIEKDVDFLGHDKTEKADLYLPVEL